MATQPELPVFYEVRPQTCPVLEAANKLACQVKGEKLPEDWQPDPDDAYLQVLAEIRHNYTNYEELLRQLPVCSELWDADECPDNPYHWSEEREWEECPLAREAHDVLKWQAKDVAQRMYEQAREWGEGEPK